MRKHERYSIECGEEFVVIHGYLSIREAFDFLAFYEREGFTCLIPGEENSCMRMCKTDHSKPVKTEKAHTTQEYWDFKEVMIWKEKCEKLNEKVIQLENIIKTFIPSNSPEDTDGLAAPKQV